MHRYSFSENSEVSLHTAKCLSVRTFTVANSCANSFFYSFHPVRQQFGLKFAMYVRDLKKNLKNSLRKSLCIYD